MPSPDAIELRGSPDQGNLIFVNPTELLQDNPAALVVNIESYRNMGAYFSPDRLDPPQVARVLSYSPEHGVVVRVLILDGMTRTKYFADHASETLPDYPGFTLDTIQVRDVTESTLRNPRFVAESERRPGQRVLTIQQYLRAVVPPTAEHSVIAADRIAAHLINGWDTMVGRELAGRFSALAALTFTTQGAINQDAMEARLKGHGRLIVDEKPEEKERIERGLLDMAQIIEAAGLGLRKNSVVQAALMLTGTESSVIGGERESWRQVYGLLYSPEVQRKLEIATEEFGERENLRVELGRSIMRTLKASTAKPEAEQVRKLVGEVLADAELTFSDMTSVFASPSPVESNNELHISLNRTKVEDAYLGAKRSGGISDVESQLLVRLGSVRYLDTSQVPAIVRAVKHATQTVNQATEFITQITVKQEELLQGGVDADIVEQGIRRLTELQDSISAGNSLQTLSRRTGELTQYLVDIEARITRQVNVHKARGLIRDVYGSEPMSDQRNLENVAFYFSGDIGKSDESEVRKRVAQFRALDPDLQRQVLTGHGGILRIESALALQEERRSTAGIIGPRGSVEAPEKPEEGKTAEQESTIEPPIAALPLQDDVQSDKRTLEERRISFNNRLLKELAERVVERIGGLDIITNELTTETKGVLYALLRSIGKLVLDQPDTVQIVLDHQQKVKRDIAVAEGELILEQEINLRETRTDR